MHRPMCVVSKDSADTFRWLRSKETLQSLQVTAKTKWSHVADPVSYLKNFYFKTQKIKLKNIFMGFFKCCIFNGFSALFFGNTNCAA